MERSRNTTRRPESAIRRCRFYVFIVLILAAVICLERGAGVSGHYGYGTGTGTGPADSLEHNVLQPSAEPSAPEPYFISNGSLYNVVIHDTIVLPCDVSNVGSYVRVWKRGIAVLTADMVKVTPDKRVQLVDGYNLQIRKADLADAGDYICQLATLTPQEITHTVHILVPPRIISTLPALKVLTVKRHHSVSIECQADGNPMPNITWSRLNNELPSEASTVQQSVLSISKVSPHHAGVYQCTASNGVGRPVSHNITLHVEYEPKLRAERSWVHSGENHEAVLVCIVHAEPAADVKWFRDTLQLGVTERHNMQSRGSRYMLYIRRVHRDDFGNYSCVAENSLGRAKTTIEFSGKPNAPEFQSERAHSAVRDSFNLSWSVVSVAPPLEYKLQFRRLLSSSQQHNNYYEQDVYHHEQQRHQNQIHHQNKRQHQQSRQHQQRRPGLVEDSAIHVVPSAAHNAWRDVLIPVVPGSSSDPPSRAEDWQERPGSMDRLFMRHSWFVVKDLESGAQYEALVAARNAFGWGNQSERLVFSTRGDDPEVRGLGVTSYAGPADRAAPPTSAYFNVVLVAIITRTVL